MLRFEVGSAIAKIRSVANKYCENQMYMWPDFDGLDPNPDLFFAKRGIEYDGSLFIRYPVKKTFDPISRDQIEAEERLLDVSLPEDYKILLETFGEFHLPGDCVVCLNAPMNALELTRECWCRGDAPLQALAISQYWKTGDGNCIGYVSRGNKFGPGLFEFDHELTNDDGNPSTFAKPLANSLCEFVCSYIKNGRR